MTSKIKVDNIANQSDSNIVNKCSTTITVGTGSDTTNVPGAAVVTGNVTGANVIASGNVVKSNALQASDAGNIISQSGTTITLGASGDTIALSAGASQTGFGRTGTVDWQTTPKTATFTAANGEGYFANTSGSAFNMNLPAGVAGAIVSVADYAESFDSNNLTVVPNGSDKIGSLNNNATLSTKGQSVTFVFVDSTQGWINTMDSTSNVRGQAPFITATGGNTIATCGNCKIHTFTGPGTFCVSTISSTPANNQVSYMVIAGGGGGGRKCAGGGGGAGGFREDKSPVTPYTASPLEGAGAVSVTATAFPIVVGGGGAAGPSNGTNGTQGSTSTFSSFSSAGGGYGQGQPGASPGPGGSGGGGGNPSPAGGSGNTPPVSPPQGNNGGAGASGGGSYQETGGGGGGATAVGESTSGNARGGDGGAGATTSISGSPVGRAGGGGGATGGNHGFPTGVGADGGGNGANCQSNRTGTSGTANTGGGGGGGAGGDAAGAGGSGLVIIRYKFQ